MKKKLLWIVLSIVLVISMVFGLAGCNKTQELVPKNIKYDGQYITWDKVEKAESYTVKINDGEEQSCATNTFRYNANGNPFSVVVSGVLGKKSAAAQTVDFKPLGAIEQDSIVKNNDGSISWKPVENATAYKVKLNGVVLDHYIYDTNFNDFEGGKQNNIQIMPVVDGDASYFSSWSKSISIKVLTSVDNINYDDIKGVITWRGFGGKYSIKITGGSGVVEDTILENSAMEYAYNSDGNDFTVEIISVGDYVNTFDSKPATQEFVYLPTISSLNVIEGNLVWDAIPEADGYKIKVHQANQDITEIVNEPKYSVKPGEDYTFEVMPYSQKTNIKYFSNWSQKKKVCVLKSPELKWDSSLNPTENSSLNLYWNEVLGTNGYKVELIKDGISNGETSLNKSVKGYHCGYSNPGKYIVKVFAVGNQSETYDSKPAEAEINRLQAPDIEKIVSNPNKLEGFTVYFKTTGASKYTLYRDENEIITGTKGQLTDETINVPTTEIEKKYSYRVASIGKGSRFVNGKLMVELDSLSNENSNDKKGLFEIVVNSTIDSTKLKMDGYNLNWTNVSSAINGYVVNGLLVNKETNALTIDLSGSIKASSAPTPVSITTKGNGENILPSKPSAEIKIQRLETPTNTKFIRDSGSKFKFECNKDNTVNNVNSYTLYLGEKNFELAANATTNLYDYISESGATFYAIANANYYDGEVYYMSSEASETRTIFRLKTPTFSEKPFEEGNYLKWIKPENIQQWSNPTYTVYSQEDTIYEGGQGLTVEKFKLNGTDVNVGENTFMVRAIGDNGVKFIDSELSNRITATKLKTPQCNIVNHEYSWDTEVQATYSIFYDNAESTVSLQGSTATAKPSFETIGTHQVKILVKGDGSNTFDGTPLEFEQKVEQLEIPKFTFKYNGEHYIQGQTLTVTVSSPVLNSNGYSYNVFNTDNKSQETTFTKPINQNGKCQISVRALGGKFDGNNTYYIDSPNAEPEFLYLLAAPTDKSISRVGNKVSWGNVENAVKYEYIIEQNSEVKAQAIVSGNQFANELIKSGVTIKIRAIGNGTKNYVVSDWVTHTFT